MNNKLSDFGEERVRQLTKSRAEEIDNRNSETRYILSFGIGLLSLCAFLASVLGFFGMIVLVLLGEITLLYLLQVVGWLVVAFVLGWLSNAIDNPDIKVGD